VNSGSGVSVSLNNGVEVVDSELVTSTSGTTVVLRGNMQTTSPYLYTPGMGAGEVMFLSRFAAGPKLEPPATGVHIWSGSAQSWKKKDSGFDAYDESGYTVKIKKMGGRSVDAVNELLQGKKIDPTRPNQYRRNYR